MSLSTYELIEIIHQVGNEFRDDMNASQAKREYGVAIAQANVSRALNRIVELAAIHAKEG